MLKYILLAAALTVAVASFAQTAALAGKIVGPHNKPIYHAIVRLLNANSVTVTDENGRFWLQRLSGGSQQLSIEAIGFSQKIISLILQQGNNTLPDIILEEQYKSLDDVTVTAEKREQLLKDVPVAVTSLSSKTVEKLQLWNPKELTAIVPTLYSANPGDNRNVTSIRGITSSSYDPAVATYIDGVNQFNLDTYIAEMLDIERIEVLRGPQGTLYGRNTMGGVINIITKAPVNKTSAFASVNIGNYGFRRYVASANLSLSRKLSLRVSGVYNQLNGFYINKYNNSNYDSQNSGTVDIGLKYLFGNSWSASFNLKQQFNRNNAAFPLIFGVQKAFTSPYLVNIDATGKMYDDIMNASFSINHSGTTVNFSSLTAYQSDYRYYDKNIDADFSPLDAISIYNNYGVDWNNVRAVTEELRFSSPSTASNIKWVAGAYFFYQHNPVKQATVFGRDAKKMGVTDSMFSVITTSLGNNYGEALFGQLNIQLSKKLELTAGLRYDAEQKRQSALGEYKKNFTAVTRPDTTATATFNEVTPKIGLLYKLSQITSVYFNYSKGFRAGGLTQISSDPSEPPLRSYEPEHSNNFEIGSKHQLFNNRLQLSLAGFLTNVKDIQVPTLILPDAITVISNAAKLRSKGAEAEVATIVFKGLSLNYSFGYTDAEYMNASAYINGKTQNLEGKKQIYTPVVTSMLGVSFTHMFSKSFAFEASTEWYYIGKQYFDLENNISQSCYQLLNARAGFNYKVFKILFSAKNITDTRYIDYAYDFGAVHLGNPQMIGVNFQLKF
jgi:iron complex outermembrane recepter protein